jgi:Tol biopolymer transport system component/DNA-binding winged helix-turn-helix (wHTH) protein
LENVPQDHPVIRFATFELNPRSGELRKGGVRLKLTGQPFQVLAILLEQPGQVVTREELQKRLWPDTFVDVDHNLNTAINKIREVLGDVAENPRFVETLPRRGYRFVAPATSDALGKSASSINVAAAVKRPIFLYILFVGLLLASAAGYWILRHGESRSAHPPRRLTRLTFDDGLQIGATWAPDGKSMAYASDRGGNLDVWVQHVGGDDPVRLTNGPYNNWQPDWSPDGRYIVYRSERDGGGLYIIPALRGDATERKIASFGYYPRWSRDSSLILFRSMQFSRVAKFYVVSLDGSAPREISTSTITANQSSLLSAAWHPDSKRISIWAASGRPEIVPTFWTLPASGNGATTRSEISKEILKQMSEGSNGGSGGDIQFSWSPSGEAIYVERTSGAARNLWRMSVDPRTLQPIAIEPLTTSAGLDVDLSISPDGKSAAFTSQTEHIRTWIFPINASSGQITGAGQPVTSAAVETWDQDLSRDAGKLVFCANRGGKWELRMKSLPGGPETVIAEDDAYLRLSPEWSPDGTQLAYARVRVSNGEGQIVLWSSKTRSEEPLTEFGHANRQPYDWTSDGKSLLISKTNPETNVDEIWLLPTAARPRAETAERKVVSSPDHSLFQSHMSPNGRWIAFEAIKEQPEGLESRLYTISTAGGSWNAVTDGRQWDDKPRWSPDGKLLYYLSNRGANFNVWALRFDPVVGKTIGEPFEVTSLNNPGLSVPAARIPNVEFAVGHGALVITVAERAGSIWMLDNVDR